MRFQISDCRLQIVAGIAIVVCLPSPIPSHGAETLVLTGATVHTVAGATIVRGEVLVQDGKIKGVYDANQPTRYIAPTNATKLDLSGLHLFPGMIALDSSLGLREIGGVRPRATNARSASSPRTCNRGLP